MTILILALIVIGAVMIFHRKEENDVPRKITRQADNLCCIRHFKIAGLSYRCRKSDIGVIFGKVTYEPTNPHDRNAIAIIANPYQKDEKLIGYIRKEDQATFKNFAYKEDVLPFTGFIEEFELDGKMTLFGKIKVYSGKEEDIETDMKKDIEYLAQAFAVRKYRERIELLDAF